MEHVPVTAREKFKVGDRVRLNAKGLAIRAAGGTRSPQTGRVTGFAHDDYPRLVAILPDKRKTASCFDADLWEVVGPDLDRAAEALVRAFHLYPHYQVDARGPAGCIMDALDEIAPDIAAEIRTGVEAGEIHKRRWPER